MPQIESANEVRVRLKAAGVNPLDTKLRRNGAFIENEVPTVLGCDGAGLVDQVGQGVTRFKPGDAVWLCHGGLGGTVGNYAEYIVVDETIPQPAPLSVDFAQAAAGPLVLITAWEALFDRASLQAGQTVLIHGGVGGVSHVAIQLARDAGAHVCSTVSTPQKAALARELGAEHVINYREQDLSTAVMEWTNGRGVDVAFDTVGAKVLPDTVRAIAHYGNFVTIRDLGKQPELKEARNRNLRISFELMLTPMLRDLPDARTHQGAILHRCAQLIDEHRLHLIVSERFDLRQVAEAHRQLEEGHVQGKLVLDIA